MTSAMEPSPWGLIKLQKTPSSTKYSVMLRLLKRLSHFMLAIIVQSPLAIWQLNILKTVIAVLNGSICLRTKVLESCLASQILGWKTDKKTLKVRLPKSWLLYWVFQLLILVFLNWWLQLFSPNMLKTCTASQTVRHISWSVLLQTKRNCRS